ncbi:MAG TPA: ABC transporter permease [Bacteroidales bacterium]|nr:ABC transporter permease [Bacteroidales bacterium]
MIYIFKGLRRHKWRTIFSVTGYALATVFILLILSVADANKNDSYGVLQSTGTHFIVYIPTEANLCTSNIANGSVFAEGVKTMMLDHDMVRTIRNVEGVKDAAACLQYKMFDGVFQSEVSIAGIDTSSLATRTNVLAPAHVISGRYFSGRPEELLAEESFAAAHDLSPGDTLKIFGGKMIVAGIVNSGIRPVKADFYAPISLVRTILKDRLLCNAPNFDMNIILVEVADARVQDNVITRIRNMMYKFAVSTYNCYQPANRVMSIIDRSSIGLTGLIFLFLVIFSAKTQLTALMERFREIGILKSLGWSDSSLAIHVFLVSLIQSVAGVTAGVLLAFGLIEFLGHLDNPVFSSYSFRLRFGTIPLIYALSLIGAVAAGLYPAIRIFRTKAGDIIRNHM